MADAPADWGTRVLAATTPNELEALWLEAARGGYGTSARYSLIQAQQAALKRVSTAMDVVATQAFQPLDRLTQQGAAALFRTVIPGIVDQFGNLNAQIAKNYYEAQRWEYFVTGFNDLVAGTQDSYVPKIELRRDVNNLKTQAARRAEAQLQAQFALAKGYDVLVPSFDAVARTDSTINFAMKSFMKNGASASPEIRNALTRAVAMYNRDTILFNAALDKTVEGVVRVSNAGACSFCRLVSRRVDGQHRRFGYAPHWHNNCHCTIEVVRRGQSMPAPPWYSEDIPPATPAEAAAAETTDIAAA